MSGPRVYGTFLDGDGLRHELSGVIDGTFSRKKGGWDSITTCGKYSSDAPDTNPDNYVTCLKCLVTRRIIVLRAGDAPVRGYHAHMTMIDEVQDFSNLYSQNPCGEIVISPVEQADLINTIGNTIIAGATRGNGGTR